MSFSPPRHPYSEIFSLGLFNESVFGFPGAPHLNTFITILLGCFLIMPPCFAVGLNVRFRTACARGDLEGIKKALQQGASIN
jgi:hypothetical protein